MRALIAGAALVAALMPLACDPPTTPPAPPSLPATVGADLAGFDSIPSWGMLFIFSATDLRPFRAAAGLFADSLVGKTLVWDCASSGYVATDTLAGAPSDGVRVVLYGSTDTGYPICPLVKIAYYDIHDVGTVDSPSMHISVRDTSLAVSYVDYTLHATAQASTYSATLSGFVSNGPQRFDITGTATGTATSRVHSLVATRVGSAARLEIQQSEVDTGSITGTQNVDARLIHGADTLRMSGAADGLGQGTWNIDVDGRHFATVTAGSSTVTYTGPDGRPLTTAEQEALNWSFVIGELGWVVLTDMLAPAGWLLGFNPYHY